MNSSEEDEIVHNKYCMATNELWKKSSVLKNNVKMIQKDSIVSSQQLFPNLHLLELAFPADGHDLTFIEYVRFTNNYFAMTYPGLHTETVTNVSSTTSTLSSEDYKEDRAQKRKAIQTNAEIHEKVQRYLNDLGIKLASIFNHSPQHIHIEEMTTKIFPPKITTMRLRLHKTSCSTSNGIDNTSTTTTNNNNNIDNNDMSKKCSPPPLDGKDVEHNIRRFELEI